MTDRLYIIDASGYVYRSYFAIRNMTNPKGESTNALFGFIRSVLKLFKDFQPKYVVSVFDGPRNAAKRTAIYPAYKGHRAEMPGDLAYQIAWAREFCVLMGIPYLNVEEVEADDTMASVARWAVDEMAAAYVCTTDKDMCQIVNDKIHLLNTFKDNKVIGPAEVQAEWGVPPEQMIDLLAMTGDTSDNIPGLSGFGPKTAAELLQKFGSLDALIANPGLITAKKKQETLIEQKDSALISRQLVTLDTQVPIPIDPHFYELKSPQVEGLKAFYTQMNFNSLLRELEVLNVAPVTESVTETSAYHLVDTLDELNRLVEVLSKQKEIAFDTETTSIRPMLAELVGIGFGFEPGEAWYVPVNGLLGLETVLKVLKPLLENPEIGFYGHNVKYDCHVLANYGIHVAHISFDTILASYLLNSHARQHSLDQLTLENFGKVKIAISDLIGKGKGTITMSEVPIPRVCEYCCEDIDYTCRLKGVLEIQLRDRKLDKLLFDLELPLMRILAGMERHGIFIDIPHLQERGIEIARQIKILEERIYEMAGERFNLNSPKQLSEILFNKMGIRPPKKTATGHSTNAEVLEELSRDYPIAREISDYRTLEKLRSTYIETLPLELNPYTKRIHCTFNQSVAATGRLSCQDPNLQNIPIRSEEGRKIREAFRPENAGWSFIGADYSQIELRLLAHLSEDPTLINAFLHNEDIHAHTAATIYGIPLDQVTKEQRYSAKAVNFGVIYGQQSYGLSQALGIGTKDAQALIDIFYQRYPRVKEFLEECKKQAHLTGKAVTMTGRERLIPEISSKNGQLRAAAERLAVNTPFQGTAADLIKMAMLRVDSRIKREGLRGYMILQIHDELIFEVPDEEVAQFTKLISEEMAAVFQLKIPLVVDIAIGKNWKEC